MRLKKSDQELENLPDDSTDVYQVSIHDRYMARPNDLEDVCLARFAAWYYPASAPVEEDDEEHEEEGDEAANEPVNLMQDSLPKSIRLTNGLGFMRRRNKRCILR